MTKYKEFMRAHGINLQCDFAALSCSDFDPVPYTDVFDVEFLGTEVLDNGVMAATCSYISGREYVVVDRYGECNYYDSAAYQAYVGTTHCDSEYIDWLRDVGFSEHAFVFDWMKRLYRTNHEVRIAFKHMKAGIMREVALCRLLARRYKKILGYYGVY